MNELKLDFAKNACIIMTRKRYYIAKLNNGEQMFVNGFDEFMTNDYNIYIINKRFS